MVKKVLKIDSKKLKSKKVFKKTTPITVVLKQQEEQSILGQQNRFFKDQFEEDKRQLFFT